MNIYVGNLSYEATQDDVRAAFEAHGEVSTVSIIMDKMTGRSRGFGFVEMDVDDVNAVISATNGREVDGRPLRVNEAEDKGGSGGGRRESRGPRERY